LDRAKKEQVVADLHQKLRRASAAILTDFKGLSVAEITVLRNALAAEQIDYCVVKNTLMRLASQDTSVAVLQSQLVGTCAVAISYGDPSVPAKIIKKYSKTNEKLKIKAGALGASLLNVDEVGALADLPPREELLGKLLGTLKAVPTSLVTVLSAVPRSFVGVLAAIQRQRESSIIPMEEVENVQCQ
jgi:large subunit ribosomal protein L10